LKNLQQQRQEHLSLKLEYMQVKHYTLVFLLFSVIFARHYIQRNVLGFCNFMFV